MLSCVLPPYVEHTLTDGSLSWGLRPRKGPPCPSWAEGSLPPNSVAPQTTTNSPPSRHSLPQTPTMKTTAQTFTADQRPQAGSPHVLILETEPQTMRSPGPSCVSSVCCILNPSLPRASPNRNCSESRLGGAVGGSVHGGPSRPGAPTQGAGDCAGTPGSDQGVAGSHSAGTRWLGTCPNTWREGREREDAGTMATLGSSSGDPAVQRTPGNTAPAPLSPQGAQHRHQPPHRRDTKCPYCHLLSAAAQLPPGGQGPSTN